MKKTCFGYSLEAPQWGTSNEYYDISFLREIKTIVNFSANKSWLASGFYHLLVQRQMIKPDNSTTLSLGIHKQWISRLDCIHEQSSQGICTMQFSLYYNLEDYIVNGQPLGEIKKYFPLISIGTTRWKNLHSLGPSCSKLRLLIKGHFLNCFSRFNTQYSDIFCWKNVSSFCTAKATHIFFSKKCQHIYVSLDVNFNK